MRVFLSTCRLAALPTSAYLTYLPTYLPYLAQPTYASPPSSPLAHLLLTSSLRPPPSSTLPSPTAPLGLAPSSSLAAPPLATPSSTFHSLLSLTQPPPLS
ncbi:hypothetical protein IWX46DRAFT_590071, partial [Phyllosticta citricarpa]